MSGSKFKQTCLSKVIHDTVNVLKTNDYCVQIVDGNNQTLKCAKLKNYKYQFN